MDYISVKGARQHNLKNINLDIPRRSFVVITGVSGSGKSSIAFDTIFAEGQRRFMESLSTYARQFVAKLEKPDFDYIEGLSPSISVDQKTFQRNPRSTVGTITEIYNFMRLLFARVGTPHCPKCGSKIVSSSTESIMKNILDTSDKQNIKIYSPIVQGRKGEYRKELEDLSREGFLRVRIDGKEYELENDIKLSRYKIHTIEVLIDVLSPSNKNFKSRFVAALDIAFKRSGGTVTCDLSGKPMTFSKNSSCTRCKFGYREISPRLFSFNSPYGACMQCNGLGTKTFFDPELIVEDPSISLEQGAIIPWKNSRYYKEVLHSLADHYGFSTLTPFNKLRKDIREKILFGSGQEKIPSLPEGTKWDGYSQGTFPGVVEIINRWYNETGSDEVRNSLSKYLVSTACKECGGSRLKKESLSILVGKKSIYELSKQSVDKTIKFFRDIELNKRERIISDRVLKEIKSRLLFLSDVGLSYLSLDRTAPTLSGGEAQRIRLATQVGSKLTGITYVLDEPSIGLHPRDNKKLVDTLKAIRDSGNTVVVVEHDEDTIRSSDYIIDMGPGAGEHGGKVTAKGSVGQILKCKNSLTGNYLSGKQSIETPSKRRKTKEFIEIYGASENNLKNINIKIPIGIFTCVTGVSGSGKSTLIIDTLYGHLSRKLYKARKCAGKVKQMIGDDKINKVIDVDQSPIGRTPKSNPATYTDLFTDIRKIFSLLPESKSRGYGPGRFSFNVKDGRCNHCNGDGVMKIEMHFLSDVYVKCEQCGGKRYNGETLKIKFRGKNIADVLNMTVDEAMDFFQNFPALKTKLCVLNEVGLGYIRLGQKSITVSGGEAQRIKLSKELSKKSTGKTLYILDEPSVGLHFDDVKKLLNVIHRLVELGNTVIVIEHNIDIIKCADHVIDLGPEGGEKGGYVVEEGDPEKLIKSRKSHTANFLRKVLQKQR